MKKKYMSPQAITVTIKVQKMIAVSDQAYGTTIMSGSASTENEVLGRGGNSLWDDDEDDDY